MFLIVARLSRRAAELKVAARSSLLESTHPDLSTLTFAINDLAEQARQAVDRAKRGDRRREHRPVAALVLDDRVVSSSRVRKRRRQVVERHVVAAGLRPRAGAEVPVCLVGNLSRQAIPKINRRALGRIRSQAASMIEKWTQQGVDVIAISPNDPDVLAPAMKKVFAKNRPHGWRDQAST